jgi:hypothetical protein
MIDPIEQVLADRNRRDTIARATTTAAADVVGAVVRRYLDTGKDSTVSEIAAELGWSDSRVRKGLADITCTRNLIIYRSQRTTVRGSVGIWLYGPSRATLRELVLAAQAV